MVTYGKAAACAGACSYRPAYIHHTILIMIGRGSVNTNHTSPVSEHQPAPAHEEIWLNRDSVLENQRHYWHLRRAQDVCFSLLALIVLAIPMLIIALLVVLDDPSAGPIFVQERVGRDGRLFRLYKFRSMCKDADTQLSDLMDQNEADGPVFKMKKDPRVTRLGHIIRKFCIDELPQLLNVLKGDMSLVGPRPALPAEVAQYTPYQRQRLYVQPGLTCYWQTTPNRHDMPFEEWLRLDLKYIQERSFRVDWKIIFSTFGVIFWAQGE